MFRNMFVHHTNSYVRAYSIRLLWNWCTPFRQTENCIWYSSIWVAANCLCIWNVRASFWRIPHGNCSLGFPWKLISNQWFFLQFLFKWNHIGPRTFTHSRHYLSRSEAREYTARCTRTCEVNRFWSVQGAHTRGYCHPHLLRHNWVHVRARPPIFLIQGPGIEKKQRN